jgi:EmrB/QacA subfamily drug resistance transporter
MDATTSSPHPKRWAILAVMCLALVVTALDTLIATMALPSIRIELHASAGQLQWVIDAYALAFAAPILFAGALADRFGRRLGFLVGMLVFLAGSVAAVVAGSATGLIAARVVMGLGAALIMPSTLSIIRQIFPAEERPKAMGVFVGVGSLGTPLGPVVGGLLLDHFWWGSVFLINVPVIALALIGCLALIPESRHPAHPGLDITGLVLSVIGAFALIDGIIESSARGWSSPVSLTLVIAGAAVLGGFIAWERRTPNPMLSHAVFSDRRFGGPLVTIASVFFGVFGGLFIVTQDLQFSLRYQPLTAGLHILPMCTAVLIAPNAPKLVQRFGLGPVSMFGPLFVSAGLVALATGGEAPSGTLVIIAMALTGIGIGFGAPTSVDSVLAATPAEQSGAGSAVADVAMQFGGALGIALLGSLAAASVTAGTTHATAVGAVIDCVAALVVVTVLPRGRATAIPVAESVPSLSGDLAR